MWYGIINVISSSIMCLGVSEMVTKSCYNGARCDGGGGGGDGDDMMLRKIVIIIVIVIIMIIIIIIIKIIMYRYNICILLYLCMHNAT